MQNTLRILSIGLALACVGSACGPHQYSARDTRSPATVERQIASYAAREGVQVTKRSVPGGFAYQVPYSASDFGVRTSPNERWVAVSTRERVDVFDLETSAAHALLVDIDGEYPTVRWRADGTLVIHGESFSRWVPTSSGLVRDDSAIPQDVVSSVADGGFLTFDPESDSAWHFSTAEKWTELESQSRLRWARPKVDFAGRWTLLSAQKCTTNMRRRTGPDPTLDHTYGSVRANWLRVDPRTGYIFAGVDLCTQKLVVLDEALKQVAQLVVPKDLWRPAPKGMFNDPTPVRPLYVAGPIKVSHQGEVERVLVARRSGHVWLLPLSGARPRRLAPAHAVDVLPGLGLLATMHRGDLVLRNMDDGAVVRRIPRQVPPTNTGTVTVRPHGDGSWLTGDTRLPVVRANGLGEARRGHRSVPIEVLTDLAFRIDSEKARPVLAPSVSLRLFEFGIGGDEPEPSTRFRFGVRLLAGLDLEWVKEGEEVFALPGGRFAVPLTLDLATASVEGDRTYVSGWPLSLDVAPGVAVFDDVVAPELSVALRYEPYGGIFGRVGSYDGVPYLDVGVQTSNEGSAVVLSAILLAAAIVKIAEGEE